MENKYTSLELSKKLSENGCELENNDDMVWCKDKNGSFLGKLFIDKTLPFRNFNEPFYICKSYDILNDICVKYTKEFFGEEEKWLCFQNEEARHDLIEITETQRIASDIMLLLQKNKKKEAEDYIWENCKFNPKNK